MYPVEEQTKARYARLLLTAWLAREVFERSNSVIKVFPQ